jgi:hypothetical protein
MERLQFWILYPERIKSQPFRRGTSRPLDAFCDGFRALPALIFFLRFDFRLMPTLCHRGRLMLAAFLAQHARFTDCGSQISSAT